MEIKKDFQKNVINNIEQLNSDFLKSGQYSTITNILNFLKRYRDDNMTFQFILKSIGIKIKFKKINKFKKVISNIIIKNATESIDIEFNNEIIIAKSFEDIIVAFRNASWDLWNLPNYLLTNIFKKLKIKNKKNLHKTIINGIMLYMLYEYKLINSFECLIDFNT